MDWPIIIMWIALAMIFIAIFSVIYYFFLRTLVRAVKKCRESARTIKPGLIWLGMIPIFGDVFMFWVVWEIAETLLKEFSFRGDKEIMSRVNFARVIGYVELILTIMCFMPKTGVLFGLLTVVFWIIYWVKISNISALLDRNEFLPDPVAINVPGVQDGSGI